MKKVTEVLKLAGNWSQLIIIGEGLGKAVTQSSGSHHCRYRTGFLLTSLIFCKCPPTPVILGPRILHHSP